MLASFTWWLFERFGMPGMRPVDLAAAKLSAKDEARLRACIEAAAEILGVEAEKIGDVILLKRI